MSECKLTIMSDKYGHNKREYNCVKCGNTTTKRTDQLKGWDGVCYDCRKEERKANAKGRVKKSVEVSCLDCRKIWMKRYDMIPKWNGRCVNCCHKYKHSSEEQKIKCRDNLKKQREINPEKYLPTPKYGENHWNWQGGLTTESNKIRQSKDYKEWRKLVFIRDDYTCQLCSERGGKLHADHIKPFSLFPDLRLDITNGRTLCVECHKNTDTYLHKIHSYKKAINAAN